MRISGVLVALVCGLISVGAAIEQPQQSASSQMVASSNPERFDGAAGIGPDSSASDRADREYRRLDPSRDGDLTCYTMDSYLVKRQSADSDVVEPSGHSSCQRASKYGVKAAVGVAPSR
jgi:hypothetical protein